MRTWVRQEAVFELNERSEFSEKGDLQLALGRVIPPRSANKNSRQKASPFKWEKGWMRTWVRQIIKKRIRFLIIWTRK